MEAPTDTIKTEGKPEGKPEAKTEAKTGGKAAGGARDARPQARGTARRGGGAGLEGEGPLLGGLNQNRPQINHTGSI